MSLDVYLTMSSATAGSDGDEDREVYWSNITHNLNCMADGAGIYQALWCPEEEGITKAAQLIEPLRVGLVRLCGPRESTWRTVRVSSVWGTWPRRRRWCSECRTEGNRSVSLETRKGRSTNTIVQRGALRSWQRCIVSDSFVGEARNDD